MASKAKADAARANGRKSRGPVTPEGKARSSQNGIKHGAYTDAVCLRGEDAEAFEVLLGSYRQIHQPSNREQDDLVHDLAADRWRLNRYRILQTAAIETEIDRQRPGIAKKFVTMDEATRASFAIRKLCDHSGTAEMYERLIARIERNIIRISNHLCQVRQRPDPPPSELLKTSAAPGGALYVPEFTTREWTEVDPSGEQSAAAPRTVRVPVPGWPPKPQAKAAAAGAGPGPGSELFLVPDATRRETRAINESEPNGPLIPSSS
jgi:hypothetical protein